MTVSVMVTGSLFRTPIQKTAKSNALAAFKMIPYVHTGFQANEMLAIG